MPHTEGFTVAEVLELTAWFGAFTRVLPILVAHIGPHETLVLGRRMLRIRDLLTEIMNEDQARMIQRPLVA